LTVQIISLQFLNRVQQRPGRRLEQDNMDRSFMQKAAGKKKVLIPAAAAAAVVLSGLFFFTWSGWIRMPWMDEQVFMERGHVLRGSWVRDGESFYYTDAEGEKTTGLQQIDGAWYYFDEGTGIMRSGWVTVDREETDAPEEQEEDAGAGMSAASQDGAGSPRKMYFREGSGKAAVGWEKIGDAEYYFSPDGILQTGWLELEGKRYLLDAEGRKCTGWQTVEGERYYLGTDGVMQTGWTEADGKKYLLDGEGHLRTGQQAEDGNEYFFDSEGALRTGWVRDGDRLYYYGKDGVMKTGLVEADGGRWYLSPDGKIRSGWQTEGEESFYVCRDGFVLETGKGTGNYGHLVVHSAGLDVDLYTARSRDEYQEVVDTENSALVVQERRDVEPVIADRRSQGFDLSGVKVDSTAAVIYPDGSIEEFVCVHTTKGINLERDVIDLEGGSLWEQNEGGLCAYASAGSENKEEVIVVFWEPLEKAEEGPEETSE